MAGTSLDAVMTASATSRSQLYHYFVDKDALISEVIKTQLGRVIPAEQEPRLRGGVVVGRAAALVRSSRGHDTCDARCRRLPTRLARERTRRPIRLGAT